MVTPYLNYFFVLYLVVLYWNLSLYNVCDMKDGFKKKKIYFVVSSLIILTGLPIRFINVQFLLKKKKIFIQGVILFFDFSEQHFNILVLNCMKFLKSNILRVEIKCFMDDNIISLWFFSKYNMIYISKYLKNIDFIQIFY